MKKKILAMLLTICMVLTLVPSFAMAASSYEWTVGSVEELVEVLKGTHEDIRFESGDTINLVLDKELTDEEIEDALTFDETIFVDVDVTIDLGDETVVYDGDDTWAIWVVGGAEVTIKNGEIVSEMGGICVGAGTHHTAVSDAIAGITLPTTGALTLTDIEVEAENKAVQVYTAQDVEDEEDGSSLLIKDDAVLTTVGEDNPGQITLAIYGMSIVDVYGKIVREKCEGQTNAIGGSAGEPFTGVLTINEGAVITAEDDDTAICMLGTGTIDVEGGTIKGDTGIYIRSGKLNVKGGEIIATRTADAGLAGSLNAMRGNAIVVEQVDNAAADNDLVVEITGGTMSAAGNNSAVGSYAQNGADAEANFVSGGTFDGVVDVSLIKDSEVVYDSETYTYYPSYEDAEEDDVAEENIFSATLDGYAIEAVEFCWTADAEGHSHLLDQTLAVTLSDELAEGYFVVISDEEDELIKIMSTDNTDRYEFSFVGEENTKNEIAIIAETTYTIELYRDVPAGKDKLLDTAEFVITDDEFGADEDEVDTTFGTWDYIDITDVSYDADSFTVTFGAELNGLYAGLVYQIMDDADGEIDFVKVGEAKIEADGTTSADIPMILDDAETPAPIFNPDLSYVVVVGEWDSLATELNEDNEAVPAIEIRQDGSFDGMPKYIPFDATPVVASDIINADGYGASYSAGVVTISANTVNQYQVNGEAGYWLGAMVVSPSSEAAYYQIIESTKAIENPEFDVDGELIPVRESGSDLVADFYANMNDAPTKIPTNIAVMFFDANEIPLTDVLTFKVVYPAGVVEESNIQLYASDIYAAPISGSASDYNVEGDVDNGTITITANELAVHENANGVKSYWVGFAINAVSGTDKIEYGFDTDLAKIITPEMAAADDTGETKANTTIIDPEDINGVPGIAFYTDANAGDAKKDAIKVRFLDEDGNVLTDWYEFDVTVTLTNALGAEIVAEDFSEGPMVDKKGVVAEVVSNYAVDATYDVVEKDEEGNPIDVTASDVVVTTGTLNIVAEDLVAYNIIQNNELVEGKWVAIAIEAPIATATDFCIWELETFVSDAEEKPATETEPAVVATDFATVEPKEVAIVNGEAILYYEADKLPNYIAIQGCYNGTETGIYVLDVVFSTEAPVEPEVPVLADVALTLEVPAIGAAAANAAVAEDAQYTAATVWAPEVGEEGFAAGEYTATITLTAAEGFAFTAETAYTLNGEAVEAVINEDGTVTITAAYTVSAEGGEGDEPGDDPVAPAKLTVTLAKKSASISSSKTTTLPAIKEVKLGDEVIAEGYTVVWTDASGAEVAADAEVGIGTYTATVTYGDDAATATFKVSKKSSGGGGGGGGSSAIISTNNKTDKTDKEDEDEDPVVIEPDNKPETTGAAFDDVAASAWYNEAVEYVVEQGLMNGVSANEFAPNANLTRGMLVTILWRLDNEPVAGADASFADITLGDWFCYAVNWAAEEGIVSGVSESEFAPNNNITREQIAAIMFRYATYIGMDTSARADLSAYLDNGTINGWASEAMQWAVAEGFINGVTDNTLEPNGTATRAQVATILMRFCQAADMGE